MRGEAERVAVLGWLVAATQKSHPRSLSLGRGGWLWLRRGGGDGGLLSQWLSQRGGGAVHEPIGGGARSSFYPQEVDALGETLEGEVGAAGVGG